MGLLNHTSVKILAIELLFAQGLGSNFSYFEERLGYEGGLEVSCRLINSEFGTVWSGKAWSGEFRLGVAGDSWCVKVKRGTARSVRAE